MREFNRHWR